MMPKHTSSKPPIPAAFTAKKNAILASLAAPSSNYTDASPKGSVDETIKGLIDRVNTLEGFVTTSSCAGRVSVFAEGRKEQRRRVDGSEVNGHDDRVTEDGDTGKKVLEEGGDDASRRKQKVVPGGKGMGGRWLYVSHEPLPEGVNGKEFLEMFGLGSNDCSQHTKAPVPVRPLRLVRFQFEPMVCRYNITISTHPTRSLIDVDIAHHDSILASRSTNPHSCY